MPSGRNSESQSSLPKGCLRSLLQFDYSSSGSEGGSVGWHSGTPALGTQLASNMSGGTSLSDVLAQVPVLLTLLLEGGPACFDGHTQRMRDLRLVSKDISVTAMREATHCSVELGDGSWPNPVQVARLLQYSRLQSVRVTINTTSARTGPLLEQQLATCTSQLAAFLHRMAAAMRSVTTLSIRVEHTPVCAGRTMDVIIRRISEPRGCPPSFSVISRTICTALAAAVPLLDTLYIDGCCRDAAFNIFGSACPQLTRLQVEALSVPLKALKDVAEHMPNLLTLTLKCFQGDFVDDPKQAKMATHFDCLSDYVGGSLRALQASISLKRMALDFDGNGTLRCRQGLWRNVPANLHDFHLGQSMRDIHEAPELFGQLQSLLLQGSDPIELLQLLRLAPHLQSLHAWGSKDLVLKCDAADVSTGIALLRKRVREGLNLFIPRFALEGSYASVQAALSTLPRLDTDTLQLVLHGEALPDPDCLEHVSRVFPHLRELTMRSNIPWQEHSAVGMELLEPLQNCRNLHTLQLCMQLYVTTAELVWLFEDNKGLTALGYVAGSKAVLGDVKKMLAGLRISGSVEEYPRGGY